MGSHGQGEGARKNLFSTQPPAPTTLINHAWAKPQSSAGPVASDTCSSPAFSCHRRRPREAQRYLRLHSQFWRETETQVQASWWAGHDFPLHPSTSRVEARLRTLGDFYHDRRKRVPCESANTGKRSKGNTSVSCRCPRGNLAISPKEPGESQGKVQSRVEKTIQLIFSKHSAALRNSVFQNK